ncbi:Unknown protein sequence [Pseudomonas syringae pv. tagetis]|uniref:Uncharacterized protein n=1 Tax=Pseudomonas syringae pv. tagetis TaxID=129140 RepID=A0A0Q0EC40_9PSED|nr:Unknown protein sequence [Pseudomonas syringae pv. tagetis]RMW15815.1 hypothetical protein ALO98_01047 [Pseudomonas syringae pv. tagetis]
MNLASYGTAAVGGWDIHASCNKAVNRPFHIVMEGADQVGDFTR